jgi:hypothetical protein
VRFELEQMSLHLVECFLPNLPKHSLPKRLKQAFLLELLKTNSHHEQDLDKELIQRKYKPPSLNLLFHLSD